MGGIWFLTRGTLLLMISCCLLSCQAFNNPTPVTSTLTLADALVEESDLAGNWHWDKDSGAQVTNALEQNGDGPSETAIRGLTGFWGAKSEMVRVGHILERYTQNTSTPLEITAADLLDIKNGRFFSPSIVQVGNSSLARCAQERLEMACRVIVKYNHIVSTIAVYAPTYLEQEVEELINQILESTDARIKDID